MEPIVSHLLENGDPAVRYKIMMYVLRLPANSPAAAQVREEVRCSPVVQALLCGRDEQGQLPYQPYKKWVGAHWTLAALADMNYPIGDTDLIPLREQVYAWLLPNPGDVKNPFREKQIVEGRVRTCASQEGNALHALLVLGLEDERTRLLVKGLLAWQWPDGGWNCDRKPAALHSSFHESLIPLRALSLFAKMTGRSAARIAAERAADLFLEHGLFRRASNREIISPDFLELHYPCYWHYDVLFGLKVMAEGGWVRDERCREALDWLESRRLPDGGFPADVALYRSAAKMDKGTLLPGGALKSQATWADWGGTSHKRSSPWVTADALWVLAAAGRL